MDAPIKQIPAVARVLIALIFVLAGISKLNAIGSTAAHMAAQGIPYSGLLVWARSWSNSAADCC